MDSQTFWMYSLAAVGLIWGVFGLRLALSVFLANAVLAFFWFGLPPDAVSPFLGSLLPFGYPLYCGAAFFLFRWLDSLFLPSVPTVLRVIAGSCLALFFLVLANKETVSHTLNLFYATYVAPVEKRPALLREEFDRSSYSEICLDSNATLMRLAVSARDADVSRLLLDAFAQCHRASTTMVQVVKPFFDEGDLDSLEFLLQSGLKPSTLISGSAYKGTALAYAASVARNREIVRALIRHNPSDARQLPFLSVLQATLEEQEDEAMLDVLREADILPHDLSPTASHPLPQEKPPLEEEKGN